MVCQPLSKRTGARRQVESTPTSAARLRRCLGPGGERVGGEDRRRRREGRDQLGVEEVALHQ
jgi:hypothetical protein